MQKPQEVRITISPQAIISIALTLFGLWLLYIIRDIVFLFVLVVAVVVALSPIVRIWEKYMPRALAILTLYLLIFFGVVFIFALVLPPFVEQASEFLAYLETKLADDPNVQTFLRDARDNLNLILHGQSSEGLSQLLSQFRGSFGAVYNTTLGLIGGVVAAITVLITSFYLLQEEKNFQQFLATFLPQNRQQQVARITDRISTKMGSWLRGQLLLMVLIGVITGVALWILGVPYPLVLGMFAGLMEAVPFVGPFIGAVPGVILAFSTLGPIKGFIAIGIYLLIQQVENQFLVPKIMGRALGLSPVIIIFSLLVGAKLLGLIGVFIAIPVAAALSVIYEEWRKED